MKGWLLPAVFILAAACAIPSCEDAYKLFEVEDQSLKSSLTSTSSIGAPGYAQAVDLIAARTEDIGAIHCWIKDDTLHVLYSTDGNWTLAETQLIVAESLEEIPTTNHGNPRVGHFPCKKEHESPVTEYRYSLELNEWGFEDANELIIAAHADVLLLSEEGDFEREEGAWGNGEQFPEIVVHHSDKIEIPNDTKGYRNIEDTENASEDRGNWAMYFTANVRQITASDLMINEIFFCGSDYSSFYFYDQFVELYNTSNDTLYLDGIILTRQTQISYPDQEEIDFVRATYAFQFPGTPVSGRQYPIAPKQFIVIASDAIDHTQYCDKSIDLSEADWECFNPLGYDYDNPDVPNIVSIHPTSTTDFLINLSHNAVVIATGEEYSFDEYAPGKIYIIIPIHTIIDGVEYASNLSATKELTVRVDAGFAGIGCTKYSGNSTERRELGLDTNNSTFDFSLIPHPTPGYSYFE